MRTLLMSASAEPQGSAVVQIVLAVGIALAMFIGHFGMRFTSFTATDRTPDSSDYAYQTGFFVVVITGCLICVAGIILAAAVYGMPWILFALTFPVGWFVPHALIYRDVTKTRPDRLS